MGRAQIFQAEAAGIAPDVRMNPILLKPTSDRQAQVVLMGQVATSMDAVSYHQLLAPARAGSSRSTRAWPESMRRWKRKAPAVRRRLTPSDRDIVYYGVKRRTKTTDDHKRNESQMTR